MIISITLSTVNTLDANEPSEANIHTIPAINGIIIRPELTLIPPRYIVPNQPDVTTTFCEKINKPTVSITIPATNCINSFFGFFNFYFPPMCFNSCIHHIQLYVIII